MSLSRLDVIKTRMNAYRVGEAERFAKTGNDDHDWNREGHPGRDFDILFEIIDGAVAAINKEVLWVESRVRIGSTTSRRLYGWKVCLASCKIIQKRIAELIL